MIFTKPRNNGRSSTKVMSVGGGSDIKADDQALKRAKVMIIPTLGFSEEDKEGTLQPHVNTLVVTIIIGGYNVKRVLVDQGSEPEIMYPDLYQGLNLKLNDLVRYDSLLVSFYGRMVVP